MRFNSAVHLALAVALGAATIIAANFIMWSPRSAYSLAVAAALAAAYATIRSSAVLVAAPAALALAVTWAAELRGREAIASLLGSLGISLLAAPLSAIAGRQLAWPAVVAWASSSLAVSLVVLATIGRRVWPLITAVAALVAAAATDVVLGAPAYLLALAPPVALAAASPAVNLRGLGRRPLRTLGAASAVIMAASLSLMAVVVLLL